MSSSRRITTIALAFALVLALTPLAGCSTEQETTAAAETETEATTATDSDSGGSVATTTVTTGDLTTTELDTTDLFSDRDLDASYDSSEATTVELSDTGSTADGSGVSVDGSTVTITEEGTYILTGTLMDGQVVVDVDDSEKVQVVLDGVSITSSSSAALYVVSADKVFLTLADGSDNTLATSGDYVQTGDDNVDGAVFSKDDLTINGDGSLTVSSAAGHGIVCKDDLKLVGGTVSVTAADHAIQANDSVRVYGGSWSLTAGTDGIHSADDEDATNGWVYVCGGTLDITAGSDGVDAAFIAQVDGGNITVVAGDDGLHSDSDLVVNGGTISVTQSYEGLEGARISIFGGTMDVVSSDDGLNASGDPDTSSSSSSGAGAQGGGGMGSDSSAWLLIAGGTLDVDASGDGLDSNGDFLMTAGEVYVSGPTDDGNGALDFGDGATGKIEGGTIVAAGSTGMAETFDSSSSQASMLVSCGSSTSGEIVVTDSSGAVVARYTPAKSYSCVVVSTAGMAQGSTYTVSWGGGSGSTEVTLDSTSYSDVSGGMGGGQGSGGMGGGQSGPSGQQGSAPGSA